MPSLALDDQEMAAVTDAATLVDPAQRGAFCGSARGRAGEVSWRAPAAGFERRAAPRSISSPFPGRSRVAARATPMRCPAPAVAQVPPPIKTARRAALRSQRGPKPIIRASLATP
jgi:hypothetical protein